MKALYDFQCCVCDLVEEQFVDNTIKAGACSQCSGPTVRLFPVGAARGFQDFQSYYDEGLGCDITGRRQRQFVMKALNVIEAGDRSGGARNFDEKAPEHMKPEPLRGEPFVPRIPAEEAHQDEPWDIGIEDKHGGITPIT